MYGLDALGTDQPGNSTRDVGDGTVVYGIKQNANNVSLL